MNYRNFNLQWFRSNPDAYLLAVCLIFLLMGILFLEISSCRVVEYIYGSNRLSGELPTICKIL